MTRSGPYIQLASGRRFYVLDPRPEDIEIEDIATSLSNQCRFTGHCRYSIAQHSVHVSMICPEGYQLWGLLHDASEMVVGDLNHVVKYLPEMEVYRNIEKKIMIAVCDRFGLTRGKPECVHFADKVMQSTEARDFMHPTGQSQEDWDETWGPWVEKFPPLPEKMFTLPAGVSRDWFLARFEQLTMNRPVLV